MNFTKPHRKVDRVFIHCSASDNPAHDNVATMDRWHKARGWSGVGYHYFIRKDGTLEAGRPLHKTPAAQAGHNRGTIAICLHGLKEENFTQAQFETLIDLCQKINRAYEDITFHGHREVAAKACPVFDYERVLGLRLNGRMGLTNAGTGITDQPDPTATRLLKKGDKGPEVRALQTFLTSKGYEVGPIDGDFGGKTEKAVFKFQTDSKLRV